VRSLIVFRHGKSDWVAGGDDRRRPLSSRCRRNAALMGRFLAASGQPPDVALCSPAVRASDTLRIAVEAGRWACEVRTCDALYSGLPETCDEVRRLAPGSAVAVLVGHEPTSSQLVGQLIGGGRVRLPTAAMARIDLEIDAWADLTTGCGELAWLVGPRLLGPG
jgi:phosphohistidine phosphatase